ncbi:helix-turn-helix domain-containing protein [Streptomyces noursei]|uniref:helix-turn-helix domain-containing protein n=1 Tax=Streptomyces noursei TaxID=1971 RepID=UPI00381637C1
MGETPSRQGTIADRLNWLIEHRHPDGTGPSTYDEIAKLSKEYAAKGGGPTISHQTVLNIRSGKVTNPGVDSLRALARVFQVQVSYLLGETEVATVEPQATSCAEPGAPSRTAHSPVETDAPSASQITVTLANRLNHLIEVVKPRGRGPFTTAEVAHGVTERGGEMRESDVAALRSGEREDLTGKQLQCLADVFGVPVGYFLDDAVAAKVNDDLALLSALREVGAREVAMRAVAKLDEDALQALVPMIAHLGKTGKRQRM